MERGVCTVVVFGKVGDVLLGCWVTGGGGVVETDGVVIKSNQRVYF